MGGNQKCRNRLKSLKTAMQIAPERGRLRRSAPSARRSIPFQSENSIEKLSAAIRGYLAESGEAAAFLLMGRAPEWKGQGRRRFSFRGRRS